MTRENMTLHMKYERIDRALYISQNVGFGEPIAKRYSEKKKCNLTITSTGVIFAHNRNTGKLITLYLSNMDTALFILNGRINPSLRNKIRKNEKYSKELGEMEKF